MSRADPAQTSEHKSRQPAQALKRTGPQKSAILPGFRHVDLERDVEHQRIHLPMQSATIGQGQGTQAGKGNEQEMELHTAAGTQKDAHSA